VNSLTDGAFKGTHNISDALIALRFPLPRRQKVPRERRTSDARASLPARRIPVFAATIRTQFMIAAQRPDHKPLLFKPLSGISRPLSSA
jgi:hypothetical protein